MRLTCLVQILQYRILVKPTNTAQREFFWLEITSSNLGKNLFVPFFGHFPHLIMLVQTLANFNINMITFAAVAYPPKFLADPGEARGCSTNTSVIN